MIVSDIITEAHSNITIYSAIDSIREKCKVFLNDSGDLPLYRGIPNTKADAIVSTLPTRRKARNSSDWQVLLFNAMIYAAFGIKNVRSKSVFCTGDFDQSRTYGDPYYCFPSGDLKFIWAPTIRDTISYFGDFANQISKRIVGCSMGSVEDVFIYLHNTYKNSTDWVISPKKYEAIFVDIFKRFGVEVTLQKFIEILASVGRLNYRDDDLRAAINSQNEIMIYEADNYYLIREDNSINRSSTSVNLRTLYNIILNKIKDNK